MTPIITSLRVLIQCGGILSFVSSVMSFTYQQTNKSKFAHSSHWTVRAHASWPTTTYRTSVVRRNVALDARRWDDPDQHS
jgi:hypothetical protein